MVRSNGGYHVFLAVLEGDWELLAYAVTWQLTTFLRFEITTPYIQQMSKNYFTGERYVPLWRITGKKSLNVVFNKHDRNVEFNQSSEWPDRDSHRDPLPISIPTSWSPGNIASYQVSFRITDYLTHFTNQENKFKRLLESLFWLSPACFIWSLNNLKSV